MIPILNLDINKKIKLKNVKWYKPFICDHPVGTKRIGWVWPVMKMAASSLWKNSKDSNGKDKKTKNNQTNE